MVRRIKGIVLEDSRREWARIIGAIDCAQLTRCVLIGAVRRRSVNGTLGLKVGPLPNDKP